MKHSNDYASYVQKEETRFQDYLTKKQLKKRNVLLIGGAGYVGFAVADHLLRRGYKVRCLDYLLYDNDHAVSPLLMNPNFEFVYGDFCDKGLVAESLTGITDVVILGGLVGDPITKKYPEASKAINEDGILNCIDVLNKKGLNKVVFISTCSNYGLSENDELVSETAPLKPLSLYAKSKVAVEEKLFSSKGKVDFHPTVLRFATAFGLAPRMRFDLTVNEFTRDIFLDKDLLVFDPHTWRPYCHVKDFARAIESVLVAPIDRVSFEVFNVGSEKNNYTKQMIIDELKEHFPQAKVKFQMHGSDPRNYKVNFSKIRKALEFEPEISVAAGIQELTQALKKHVFSRVEEHKKFYGNYEINYPANK